MLVTLVLLISTILENRQCSFCINKTCIFFILNTIQFLRLFLGLLINFVLIRTQSYRFFAKSNKILFFLRIFTNILEKRQQNFIIYNKYSKKNCLTDQLSTILSLIMVVFLLKSVNYSEKPIEPKQYLSIKCPITKKSPFGPLLFINDIVWSVSIGCENESINQGRSFVQSSINISQCFFSRSSIFSGYGGVIFVQSESYSVSVNHSMFYNCVCSNEGGAIYIISSNSYFRMICAHRCSCGISSYFQFSYLSAFHNIHVEYLSLSYCSHIISGNHPFCLHYGYQEINNLNSSMNKGKEGSGVWICSPYSFTSIYNSFSNNIVSLSICIWFNNNNGIMSYTNIVHNNSPSGNGVVYVYDNYKMLYCIFHMNHNVIFYVHSGSLEISHSFLSQIGSSYYGVNNSYFEKQTYQIQFFKSYHCYANFPLLMQTPIMTIDNTIKQSIEETIRLTNEETKRITEERTIDQTKMKTIKESILRTYDSKCDMKIFSHDQRKNKMNTNFLPVFISFVMQ